MKRPFYTIGLPYKDILTYKKPRVNIDPSPLKLVLLEVLLQERQLI